MTVELEANDLLNIHEFVRQQFNVPAGANFSLVDSIVNRPSQGYHGMAPFPNIWLKAASIMESIIRWHPFTDGNKRTALAAISVYLEVNGYYLMLPYSAVRFSVEIARIRATDSDTNRKLLYRIAKWIQTHSARKGTTAFNWKFFLYLEFPANFCVLLYRLRLGSILYKLLSYWLAFDVYPEYQENFKETMQFMTDIMKAGAGASRPTWWVRRRSVDRS